ncbi:restriction endonuclease subunit S [Acinetobacter towneri]|uniref:Restriction endonuclease subunit S n=1 Tax=Acinetobacter towneri TaxID=202956 RepID=A0AAP9GU63_9GAMM|nr:restriction endonuclease subunit S [Acinetobacter towneri]QGM27291.1 restriction endonuclease subunit S [Acinetobacter towneri]
MFKKYDAYKDSSVEWIGNIPAEWSLKKISHVFRNIGSGTTPLSGSDIYYKNGSINWLQTGDLNDGYIDETSKKITEKALRHYSTLKQYSKGSLVVAMYGATIGKVGILNIDTATNQACCVLGANFGVDIKYYFYMLQGFKADIIRMAYGGGQPNISQETIKNLRLPFPDLSTQHEISKFLDQKTSEIDQAIAIKEQQIALLNERKQILIQKAVTQGLNTNVPMKDSGVEWIGQIPQHWIVKKLKYVLKERSERSKDGLEPLLMMSQVHGLVVRSEYSEKTEVAATTVGNKLVYKNDLVFNKLKAHLGVFFSSVHDFAGCVSPDYAVYDCVNYIENTKFLELLFRNPLYIKQFILRSSGIVEGLIRLYTTELFDLKIGIPPKDEQMAILKHIEEQSFRFDEAVKNYSEQIEKLKEYKTTLINDAVTGKIKVA